MSPAVVRVGWAHGSFNRILNISDVVVDKNSLSSMRDQNAMMRLTRRISILQKLVYPSR